MLIRSSPEKSEIVFQALADFGAPLAGTSPADFCALETIVQLGVEPSRINILQTIPGAEFDELWANRTTREIDEACTCS